MRRLTLLAVGCCLGFWAEVATAQSEPLFPQTINVTVPEIGSDSKLRIDYDIVYVRAPRAGDETHKRFFTDFSTPVTMEPGADLMLLHPDGSEELLVEGGEGSVTDPMVSFDGRWVYYVHIYNLDKASQWNPPRQGADIFKIHLESRQIVRLTNQRFSPNTGAAPWSRDFRSNEQGKTWLDVGVYNMGPCPLPGGKIVFTSNRDGFRPAKGYPAVALQLFVMDDRDESIGDDEDPVNLEKIGHLNISGALHPVVLKDGRIMYSSLESQGIRDGILWGIWTIHPDGTMWAPLISAFDPGGAPNGFHFQTQLSDGSIVVEEYYNQNNSGFGAYVKLPAPRFERPPTAEDEASASYVGPAWFPRDVPYPAGQAFGPAYMQDSRNEPWRYGRHYNAKGRWYRLPFMPTGAVSLTPFTHGLEGPAGPSDLSDAKNSPQVGKFTHPSAAPGNHLLTCYSPGPVNHQYRYLPQLDGGIYLIPDGQVLEEPAQMRLIKNDPKYNECWPRAVVPYRAIYGIDEPRALPRLANNGQLDPRLPAGTPFGLIGASSFYKRESYPNGVVPPGSVTAQCPEEIAARDPWKGLDAFTSHGNGMPLNFHNQGGDVGLYDNNEIHAVRILAMEPTTLRQRGEKSGRLFYSHATERLRILGEIPLRKFQGQSSPGGVEQIDGQPVDPDGNPDTSFLARIPADTAFTFQTIDHRGLMLNMSQTWHQLRPGEIRTNCGGCHAHSQQPTDFALTAAAKGDYPLWDLTAKTPLIVDRQADQSQQKWDQQHRSGLREAEQAVVDVEYFRDVQPILARSCAACHTSADGKKPAGNLDLNADHELISHQQDGKFPGTYLRLALDEKAQFGHKPPGYDSWGYPNASRYVRKFQARRSLLVWKIFGDRLDGFSNDDHPSESKPGARDLVLAGQPVDMQRFRAKWDLDYVGSAMPPEAAVKAGKVAPLSDEDRRTIARWIDLGCPIDLDYDPELPDRPGYGWMCDDNRPVVTLARPHVLEQQPIASIVLGMYDYYSGLDLDSLQVTADVPLAGKAAGENLASLFKPAGDGIWEWKLSEPLQKVDRATLNIQVRDNRGNTGRLSRTFTIK